MKGPGIFLAQFMGEAPFDRFDTACRTMADFGYTGVQVPSNDARCMDLRRAAESQDYCDELLGTARENGVEISELSAHLQGQLVAVHPAYDHLFDGFAPTSLRGRPEARTVWAAEQMKLAAVASRRMGLTAVAAFSGALAWPFLYPWPQRPAGLIEEAFDELALRWQPILDVYDDNGIELCFELHPGEDLHDGATFEAFLERLGGHRCLNILYDPSHFLLQQLDYVDFIERYHERIKMFHVKDAEFRPNGRAGIYGGYLPWKERPGRFRSTGDGQVDFKRIFSSLTQYGYDGWAIIEWECALKDAMQGAAEGAPFIREQMIEPASKAFDDFAEADPATNRATLGLPNRALAAE